MKVCVCVSSFFLLLLQFGLEFMVDYCTMVTDSLIYKYSSCLMD